MFIGREYEMKKLNDLYHENSFQCIIMYGRRRVGKTRLLTEFCKDKKSIFYVGREHNDKYALEQFSQQIITHFQLNSYTSSFLSWDTAFSFLGEQAKDEQLVLVLDEFPYMAASNKSMLSILQNSIDHILSKTRFFIVLCGSSVSFMENEVLAHKSPLFGRRTAQLLIHPLDFFHALKFFPDYTVEEKLNIYGVLGGIPQYLLQFNANRSFDENMKEKLFEKSSYLFMEAEFLVKQGLNSPSVYISIIEAISGGASRLNDIALRIGETTSKTAIYTKTLINLKILHRLIPITEKENSRRSIYQIQDNFFSFYYRHVRRYLSGIEQELGSYMYDSEVKGQFDDYLGYIFEQVCREYLMRKNKNLETPFLTEKIGSWWGTDPNTRGQEEIDIVGIGKDRMLLAECKYTKKRVGMAVYQKLIERSTMIRAIDPFLLLFSKNGFEDDLILLSETKDNLMLVTLDEMVNELS